MEEIKMTPIGVIRSPHKIKSQTPIQPTFARGISGAVEIYPEYEKGLKDIEGFSYIQLICYFHEACEFKLHVKPYLEDAVRGVFATRAPSRPNFIGLSILKLIERKDNVLHVEDIDLLDGTPVLDVKPFITRFDIRPDASSGWQDNIDEETAAQKGLRDFKS